VQTETLPALRAAPPALETALASTRPFRRRVLLGALLAGVLFVWVAGALAWRQYDDARASALNDARTRVILAAGIVDQYFSGELSTLTAVAQAPPVQSRTSGASTRPVRPRSPAVSPGWTPRASSACRPRG
jgi:hypothetical protein